MLCVVLVEVSYGVTGTGSDTRCISKDDTQDLEIDAECGEHDGEDGSEEKKRDDNIAKAKIP